MPTRSYTFTHAITRAPGAGVTQGLREVDTGVEMRAGQTLALAGLIQTRVETVNRGIPWLSDLPWIGAPFRRVQEENNEIELLILVRPELVEALEPHEVPPGGPGLDTASPRDVDFYWRGHMEVPAAQTPYGGPYSGPGVLEDVPPSSPVLEQDSPDPQARRRTGTTLPVVRRGAAGAVPTYVTPRAGQAPRSPSRINPYKPSVRSVNSSGSSSEAGPGLIGPIGYDVQR